MTLLVTGGAGFIGGTFVRELIGSDPTARVVILDKLTYAADPTAIPDDPRVRFVRGDIIDRALVRSLLVETRPDALVHFAAESHVDRSIDGPEDFVQTNVVGTFHLLEECRRYLASVHTPFRFVHISTDEVFGALGEVGSFTEASPYSPRSPYSASKGASDHFVRAYIHTYGFPALITHCTNNYGPYQHREKLIPRAISRALQGERIPVFARGENVRDWIHVSDHCAAVRAVLERGELGETYVIGARNERRNIDVVHLLCDTLDVLRPRADGGSYRALIEFIADRPGHDFRYAVDPKRIERELGWSPRLTFEEGIRATVAWYANQ